MNSVLIVLLKVACAYIAQSIGKKNDLMLLIWNALFLGQCFLLMSIHQNVIYHVHLTCSNRPCSRGAFRLHDFQCKICIINGEKWASVWLTTGQSNDSFYYFWLGLNIIIAVLVHFFCTIFTLKMCECVYYIYSPTAVSCGILHYR